MHSSDTKFYFPKMSINSSIKSEREREVEGRGFNFITNFSNKHSESIYRQAAKIHNLKIFISDQAYDNGGRLIDWGGYKALYVDSSRIELSPFWRTVDKLEIKHKGKNATDFGRLKVPTIHKPNRKKRKRRYGVGGKRI